MIMRGKTIVFCRCDSEISNNEELAELSQSLRQISANIIFLDDLCGLAVTDKDRVKTLFNFPGQQFLVIACFARAVKLLIEYAGAGANFENFSFVNIRQTSNNEVVTIVQNFLSESAENKNVTELRNTTEWKSWFPVIDYNKCTSCGQCSEFCLFSVYQNKEGRVEVINPQNCKINCPACARICPSEAIIFPKFKDGGHISGDETSKTPDEKDISEKESLMQLLEKRKENRRSIIKETAMQQALIEREKAKK
jgi:Pyruvate/2-oxoacid:ferredoxin oxidoreductase delta subunit